ncbi:DUF6808 domain-containing protein [Muribaculum intestinale]|uniref:DUF6808 domain-containing protein n=1 Tax=Muribaculum intestinale TaxID=1796646 RepID=UPI0024332136|nr:hypothetical protein [Muribaculum intestinale]
MMSRDTLHRIVVVFKMLILSVGCIGAGAYMHRCQWSGGGDSGVVCVTDTVTYIDTVRYYEPVARGEVSLGTQITFLPVYIPRDSVRNVVDNIPCDSVAVEIPVTQREYEGEEYRAWVSGYEPRMDSIYVYPRHEVVTIREVAAKPKRWGIGVFAGYGMTPRGLEPCVGVSVSYNLWNF